MKAILVNLSINADTPGFLAIAQCADGSKVILTQDAIDVAPFMRNAAMELAKELNYRGAWIGDQLPTQDWAFICIDPDTDLVMGVRE